MDAVLDTLHNALRPFPCKWEGCSATLASWKLLVKTYLCLIKDAPRGHPCNTGFSTQEGLSDHLLSAHLNRLVHQCPAKYCKVNLQRFKDDFEAIQDHLDQHIAAGESIPLATLQHLQKTLPLPSPPTGNQPSFKLVAPLFKAPTFSSAALAKARHSAAHNPEEANIRLFGTCIRSEWLEEEESEGPAECKIGTLGARVGLARSHPRLSAPPLFLASPAPRCPMVSVGFHSERFYELAETAFEKVAGDMETDHKSEDEFMN
ncbi:hypothetical protein CTheo_2200 [Ceratobasidium theobromae]|uniref:Uncharacterized protein n=1 Tax=Ceratobasidium theobromae TaxID=1582974 RepID=A0A5N5QS76_9AGAM|nr:hypothetical protein CTheo_2200 [Ceratobasidium theobromae]